MNTNYTLRVAIDVVVLTSHFFLAILVILLVLTIIHLLLIV